MATNLWIPISKAEAGWKIDEEKLTKAIEMLEIKYPVDISKFKQVGRNANVGGYHYFFRKRHKIRLSTSIFSSYTASCILWHELIHCVQGESFPTNDDFLRAYRMAGGSLYTKGNYENYHNNYFEVEAREKTNCYKDMNLCYFAGEYNWKDRCLELVGL